MSKHANRRKKKKQGQVTQGEGGQNPLTSEADPSLDDVKWAYMNLHSTLL